MKNLKIIRSTGEKVTVDVSKIWKQREPAAEERLAPGDTLVVPSTTKINWNAVYSVVLVFSTLYAIFK